MSKDVSIPTFTIQYLMESGQGLTSNRNFEKEYLHNHLPARYTVIVSNQGISRYSACLAKVWSIKIPF